MQPCAKCASSVPDGRTSCQICGAELDPATSKASGPTGLQAPVLSASPAAQDVDAQNLPGIPGVDRPDAPEDVLAKQIGGGAPRASGGVELRRTLAGDIIEVPVSGPVRAGGPLLGDTKPGGPPPRPIPTAGGPRRSSLPPQKQSAMDGEDGGGGGTSSVGLILVILLVIVLAGGAGGYWYWQQSRPAAAVTLFMESVNAHKWNEVYDQMELPAQVSQQLTKETFQQMMSLMGSNLKIGSVKIEGTTITGDTAKVKVTATTTIGAASKTDTTDIPLRMVNGIWKIDFASGGAGLPGVGAPGR